MVGSEGQSDAGPLYSSRTPRVRPGHARTVEAAPVAVSRVLPRRLGSVRVLSRERAHEKLNAGAR